MGSSRSHGRLAVNYCYQQEVQRQSKSLALNVVCASSRKAETDVLLLIDSQEETIVLAAERNAPLVAGTRSGQSYLKKYDEVVANPPKPCLLGKIWDEVYVKFP